MSLPDFLQASQSLHPELVAWRRDFHQHPELGFQEQRTAAIVASELTRLGLQVTTAVAETGVVALLEGGQPGPTLLLRVDMDALPIQEENENSYASQVPGVMHACGHDAHTAIGMGVARMLQAHQAQMAGRIKFVFQPAEEGLGGAQRMVEEGVLSDPAPDYSLGVHVWNEKPVGWLGITSGPCMAGAETFEIKLTGKGGHGAAPHQTYDPVLAAAGLIQSLQSIVSRNVAPLDTAVVSVTMVQAGEAFNIIPNSSMLRGTIRTFLPEVRDLVLSRFNTLVQGTAALHQCKAEVKVDRIAPPVINDEGIAARLQSLMATLLPEATISGDHRTMGSEDMAYMMETIPGCYLFVGSGNPQRGLDAPHHNPRFDIDETCLPLATALVASAAWHLLEDA